MIVRGLQGRPWDANDIALALRSAEVAVQLRQALTNAVHGDQQRPTSNVEKGAGKGSTAFNGVGQRLGD